MENQITNYQCPACTGPLEFSAATGKLACSYCGSSFEVDEVERLYAEEDEKAAEAFRKETNEDTAWQTEGETWDENGMRSYSCPSCGAQLICDETTAATACPYCGNQSIVPGQLDGVLKPDYIIPFAKTKEEAQQALKDHYKGKVLLPKAFSDTNHLQEIQGIYVPFWLFDGTAMGQIHYECTDSHTVRRGNYEVTTTKHYKVRRGGAMDFTKVLADASSKMDDRYMDAIEPYDYSQLKPFSNAYLPGFLADKYDVDMESCTPRVEARCQDALADALRNTVRGYDTCSESTRMLHLHRGKVQYALLPVWVLHTKWKDRDYMFAMNGQTGRMVGDLPVSWGKFWGIFAAISAPLMAIMAYFFL